MKKYEFTGETKTAPSGTKLRRIRAIKDFGCVKAGEVGGWLETEENLSHSGNCWVSGNGEVSGNGKVFGNGKVCGNGEVSGNGKVFGNGEVFGNGWVFALDHIFVAGPCGSRNGYTTFYRDKDNEITVKCGCFNDKLDKFLQAVRETHGDNKYALVYRAIAEAAKLQIDLTGAKQ